MECYIKLLQLEEWKNKYAYLIKLGENLQPLTEKERNTKNLIQGCQARTWILLDFYPPKKLKIRASSDSRLVLGLIFLLQELSNYLLVTLDVDQWQKDSVKEKLKNFLQELKLWESLSLIRQNGLNAILDKLTNTILKNIKKSLD